MIYEDPVERYMIISSPYNLNDEEWINPYATIVEYEAPPYIANSFHMQTVDYDEKFENLGHHISSVSSMISSSYLSNISETC